MNYVIENDLLKVEITDKGAEIQSIVGKKTGTEYLWQGDPTYWAMRATVLFPICGRLTGGKYLYEGKEYEMVLHGFAKLSTFSVVAKANDSITFELRPNDETRASYPFDFILRMTYSLAGATVRTAFDVKNPGKGDLPFSVGGHPGFNIPFVAGEKFEDYYIEFPEAKPVRALVNSETCYYTGKTVPFALEDGTKLSLRHDLFDNDAIFLADMPDTVSLKSKKNDRSVTVHFNDMTHLGFWHRPHTEAPYMCIEPWHGVPAYDGVVDDFATKNEMMHLEPGKSYSTWFDITISE